jgi:pimeloyl-ACP methyl ester carboxylesterase
MLGTTRHGINSRARTRVLFLVVAVVCFVLQREGNTLGVAVQPKPPPTCQNAALMAKSSKGTSAGGWTPVLLVHGITSSLQQFSQGQIGGGPPLAQAISTLPGAAVYGFDYSKNSLDWVTSSLIAPELASAITCLAQSSGRQVVVVAHSMGGLATQQAQASLASNELAEAITIGTPTKGAWVLAAANKANVAGLVISPLMTTFADLLLKVCGISGSATPQSGACAVLSSKDTPAGQAMTPGSAQLAALPAWKPGVTVARAVGDMTVEVQAGLAHKTVDVGDGVVTKDSALAGANGPTFADPCGPIPAFQSIKPLSKVLASECYHGNETRDPALVAWVIHQIAKTEKGALAYKAPTEPAGYDTPAQALSAFITALSGRGAIEVGTCVTHTSDIPSGTVANYCYWTDGTFPDGKVFVTLPLDSDGGTGALLKQNNLGKWYVVKKIDTDQWGTPLAPYSDGVVKAVSTDGLNMRTAPSVNAPLGPGQLSVGSMVRIHCQASGDRVASQSDDYYSTVWDKVDLGFYITDLWVDSTPEQHNIVDHGGQAERVFDPTIPRCDATDLAEP